MESHLRYMTVFLGAVGMWGSICSAREFEEWPYSKLFRQADVVVIAKPVLTEAAKDKPPEDGWPLKLQAHNTTFQMGHTIKGKVEANEITVLHFKYVPPKEGVKNPAGDIINPPLLVEFPNGGHRSTYGPEVSGEEVYLRAVTAEYLLFLKRMKDGRYEPVSGRMDPGLSVRKFSDPTEEAFRSLLKTQSSEKLQLRDAIGRGSKEQVVEDALNQELSEPPELATEGTDVWAQLGQRLGPPISPALQKGWKYERRPWLPRESGR